MTIPHSRPFVGAEEIRAVRRVIASGHLAQGDEVDALERELSTLVGHTLGVAVSSGTAAIYLALRALNVKEGDRVVIPSYVCTALLNATLMAGATPVLADVSPVTGNLRVEDVRKVLTRKTKAVIVPHLFGNPADALGIAGLGVPIIEDCAQCVGTSVNGRPVGGLTAISVFSFYATKLIAAGEGGMVACSDRGIADRIRSLRQYDKQHTYRPSFNFKLSDVHAAIARAQVRKLPRMIARRRTIALAYWTGLHDCSPQLVVPNVPGDHESAYFRFVVAMCPSSSGIARQLNRAGIECGKPIFRPLHQCLRLQGCPNSELMQRHALSLPIHPGMSDADLADVVRKVKEAVRRIDD